MFKIYIILLLTLTSCESIDSSKVKLSKENIDTFYIGKATISHDIDLDINNRQIFEELKTRPKTFPYETVRLFNHSKVKFSCLKPILESLSVSTKIHYIIEESQNLKRYSAFEVKGNWIYNKSPKPPPLPPAYKVDRTPKEINLVVSKKKIAIENLELNFFELNNYLIDQELVADFDVVHLKIEGDVEISKYLYIISLLKKKKLQAILH